MRILSGGGRRVKRSSSARVSLFENLESRRLLSLLGIMPYVPAVALNGEGTLTYSASSKAFDASTTPVLFILPDFSTQPVQDPRNFGLDIKVNNDGTLNGSGTGPADVSVTGWLDMNNDGIVDAGDYNGVLLTGTITQFGYQDNGDSTATYDFRFTVTGGLLDIPTLFQGQDAGVVLDSENSTFVDVNPGDPGFNVDFTGTSKGVIGAIPKLDSISGVKYNDLNDSGVYNSGDPGINGVSITLSGTDYNGNPVLETTTTSTINGVLGSYTFSMLNPGTYTLTETPPAGYVDGQDAAGTDGGTVGPPGTNAISNINLDPSDVGGDNATGYNFADYQTGSLSGTKYVDSNDNDVDNSEPGLGGVTITLTGTNGAGNAVDLTTTTASDGSYSFTGLAPGTYTLTETPPAGYVAENGDVGSLGGTAGTAVVSGITVTSGETGTGYNFAEYQTTSLSGIKYIDSNGNDADNSEPGLAGVTITLSGTNGMGNSVLQTTTTAANGSYSFTGLAPGLYTLTETPPAGYVTEGANVGTLGGTSGNAVVSGITLTSGQSGSGYNFAEYQTSSLSGIKYIDSNGNDVDNSEPGLAGVTITLSGTNGMGNSVLQTTTTAANGSYSFTGLAPGVYTLTETPPAGYVTEGANVGTLGGTSGNAVVSGITLTSGQSGSGYNFAEYQTSSLSGNVYLDSNANDVDNSEPGIGGVTVTLTGTNGLGNPVTLTTTSASNGTYSFTGLAPGTYTVTETQPAGYTAETANAGSLGGTAAVGVISSITVLSGNSGTNYNFGELQPVNQSLSGTVYKDITGNGLSADDTPLSGVVVELFKDVNGNGVLDSSDGSPIATYTTGASGQYSFTSVAVGNYIVAEVTPSGYVITAPAVPDYYAETVASGANITGLNFDNYNESCTSNLKCVTFKLNNNGCITTVTDLRGNTVQNETVSVTFTVPTGAAPMQYTLVSYNAPDSYFNASDASQQTEYQVATGTFGPGTYTLTVTIPCNYYQIDFVCGAAISQLGPAGSNIFYSAQNRLISADNGGLHDDVDDEAATMHFWANLGQSLIKNFGGASTNTALGTWLKTTMPNVFGGSLLGNLTNTTVAAKYMSFYNVSGQQNWAQMMATALNVYASTLSLGGTVASTYGFDVTSDGLGAAQFNVGNNGSAFGVSNSSTITVSQMLSAINSKSTNDVLYNNVASLLNQCYNELGQVNGDGGLN